MTQTNATPRRILLLEGDADMNRVMARLLRHFGDEVVCATTVREALIAAGAGRFDVLVSRIWLHDGPSTDLMRELRKSGTKGIVIGGGRREEEIAELLAAGFDQYMDMPVMIEGLRRVIDRLAGSGDDKNRAAPA